MKPFSDNTETKFSHAVAQKEKQKLKALREHRRSEWAGFGLFGMVGWSVAVPTLLGTSLGLWLDDRFPRTFSWTLSFLFIGLVVGCAIAWNWIGKENKQIHQKEEENHE